jgi:serine phosphatase RsbU (regulator of sigma subunit)
MRDELKMASVVQEMLLPTTTIDGTRCQWSCHSQPSTETGGDWFTIVHSPEMLTTTAVIADVTGHGAPAALVTAIVHGFFKATHDRIAKLSAADWQPAIDEMLRTLNRTVIEATRGTLTSSLSLLTFDHRTLKARYVNAGHHAAVLVSTQQVTTVSCPPSSMIGDIEQPNFTWGELQMQPQQLILLYTDGLIECTNTAQEMYGFKRLRKLLTSVANRDARSVRDLIIENAASFYGDMPRADDITVIVGSVR